MKILCIPGDQRETTIEGGGRDQGVWQTDAVLLPQCDGPLHHRLVKWDFLEGEFCLSNVEILLTY